MTDHIPDAGKMVSARDALATALVRHIEGDSVTRDLITDAEWSGYQSDADYVLELLSVAGFAVVPQEPTDEMCEAARARHDTDDRDADKYALYRSIGRAMIAATLPAAPTEARDDRS